MDILKMRGIYKEFPGVVAVDHVDLTLQKGEIMALLGENGAGKSTLIKVLSGAYHADKGSITIEDKTYKGYTTNEAIELGIGVVYQELNYVGDVSIAENLYMNNMPVKGGAKRIDYARMYREAEEVMEQVGLGHCNPRQSVKSISVAEKQLLEIGKAFTRNVKILIMDEPTSALNDAETDNLFKLIRDLKARGVSIIYISHRMNEIFKIADTAMVMRDGRYIVKKSVSETNTDELVSYMVGREITDMYPERNAMIGEDIFVMKNLTTSFIKQASFHIRGGEVVGLFGLMGAGRTEMAKCIIGAKSYQEGEMLMQGRKYHPSSPKDALKNKIAYVPSERKEDGLVLISSVRENITLANLNAFTEKGKMNLKKEKRIAQGWREKLNIKTPDTETKVENLSGGNQQKVVVAKVLNTEPQLIILNEPTRGIDVGAKVEIYNLINRLCGEGKAILLISSELPEIMSMADRIYTVCEGQITGELQKQNYTQELLVKYAIGERVENG